MFRLQGAHKISVGPQWFLWIVRKSFSELSKELLIRRDGISQWFLWIVRKSFSELSKELLIRRDGISQRR